MMRKAKNKTDLKVIKKGGKIERYYPVFISVHLCKSVAKISCLFRVRSWLKNKGKL